MKKFITLTVLCVFVNLSYAKDIIVTNSEDSGDGSLRQAITLATSGDKIVFNISNGKSNVLNLQDQIVIDKTLSIDGINKNNGDTLTLKQNRDTTKVIACKGTGTVLSIKNLKITNGTDGAITVEEGNSLFLEYCTLFENRETDYSYEWGGALNMYGNTHLKMNHCTIDNNEGYAGGAIAAWWTSGDRIVEIENSYITNNISHAAGGGMALSNGKFIIKNTVISNNESKKFGGGINLSFGDLQIDGCTISANEAYSDSGGISSKYEGNVAITNSTICNNKVVKTDDRDYRVGGGLVVIGFCNLKMSNCTLWGNEAQHGAGLYCMSASEEYNIELANNTFFGNMAEDKGGAIYIGMRYFITENSDPTDIYSPSIYTPTYPKATFINNTIVNNEASSGGGIYFESGNSSDLDYLSNLGHGELTLYNNLIALNSNNDFVRHEAVSYNDMSYSYLKGKNNIGLYSGLTKYVDEGLFTPYNSESVIFENNTPLLADNGGATQTVSIPYNSIAVGKGLAFVKDVTIPAKDQRGITRNNPPSIGSFEYNNQPSGIENIPVDLPFHISCINKVIQISNIKENALIRVFDLTGKLCYNKEHSQDENVQIPLSGGVYIVKVGKYATKIQLK